MTHPTHQIRTDKTLAPAVAIGIDVGGTSTRVGGVDETGRLIAARRIATTVDATGDALIAQLLGSVEQVRAELHGLGAQADRIGLALPGILDRGRRMLTRSINLPYLEGRPLADELERATQLRVVCMSDAEAATWGEYCAEKPPSRRFAHIRLGTGVACGVVVDGHLQDLSGDRMTHLDTLVVDESADAPQCRCGRRGCLEAIASGIALARQAKHAGRTGGLAALQLGWERGEQAAVRIVHRAARATLSAAINLVNRFDCRIVTVGGGVVLHLPALLEAAIDPHRALCRASGTGTDPEHAVALRRAHLGDDAGVIGAALIALD
ncbi:MAG: ROK family protein [Planctomycetes bacterium]|nr:ROK family protein [Planctomycetota bacterium]